jgi:hypothetical protein
LSWPQDYRIHYAVSSDAAPSSDSTPTARIAQASDVYQLQPFVRMLLTDRRRALSESQIEREILKAIGDGDSGGYLLIERAGIAIGICEIDAAGTLGTIVAPDPQHAAAVDEALQPWRDAAAAAD